MNDKERKGALAGLRHALDVVRERRVLRRKPEYIAALDELEIFLNAAIERLENGEEMHATNVVQDTCSLEDAVRKHLPALKQMAAQIISPKDNTFSRMVNDFEKALE